MNWGNECAICPQGYPSWSLAKTHSQRPVVKSNSAMQIALVRFDLETETFPLPSTNAAVRQMLGRPGEVWGAASGTDKLVVVTLNSE